MKSSNQVKILFILSSLNINGGTPKKTLDLLKYFKNQAVLYVYDNDHPEYRKDFESSGALIYEGCHHLNLIKHLRNIIQIIDKNGINIVQTHFSMGEILGALVKIFRPKIKLIIAFVGPFSPYGLKKILLNQFYKKADAFIFISEYVRREKVKQFKVIEKKMNVIFFNGAEKRSNDKSESLQLCKISLLDVAGLVEWKNIMVLIETMNILINITKRENYFLYVAGDGPQREDLQEMIINYNLTKHVFLLGYQVNIGHLLDACDIFVHPAYAEGFGIAVAEAMLAEKPIIVANAGALPELIEHEKTGIITDPFNPEEWANAILRLIDNYNHAKNLGRNAKIKAENDFSIQRYAENLDQFYNTLLLK